MTAMRIGRVATVLILCGAWLGAAYVLWRTSVPSSLDVSGLDQHRYFTPAQLARAARYERFTDILWAAQVAATIVALVVLTRRAPRLARSIGLGPIGTGVIVGMVMLVTLWFVRLPFGFLSQWWDARHGLAPHDYVSWIFAPWAQVLSEAVFGLVTIVIVMGLAGKLGNRWWIAGAPVFAAIVCAFAFLGGYLAAVGTHRIHQPKLRAAAHTLERREHVGGTPVRVQDVGKLTKEANAFSSGFGPSRNVVLWNTLFRPPFTFGEVRFVLAHELGHTWHKHVLKAVGWFALFAFPIAWFVTVATRRRGGLGNPASLPLALLALTVANFVTAPVRNYVSRRYEAEADWSALNATNDPASGRKLFVDFARTTLQRPDPPTWAYLWLADHPTLAQRLAMMDDLAKRR